MGRIGSSWASGPGVGVSRAQKEAEIGVKSGAETGAGVVVGFLHPGRVDQAPIRSAGSGRSEAQRAGVPRRIRGGPGVLGFREVVTDSKRGGKVGPGPAVGVSRAGKELGLGGKIRR